MQSCLPIYRCVENVPNSSSVTCIVRVQQQQLFIAMPMSPLTHLQAISNEIQSRLMKKDAAIYAKSRELADSARSFAESERFLKLQVQTSSLPPLPLSIY